jgi:DNA-binding NtrC family response regulator
MASREVERSEPPTLAPAVLQILRQHHWPGNVRELRNAIGRAVVLCLGDVVVPEHLPPSLLKAVEARPRAVTPPTPPPPTASSRPKSERDAPTLQSELENLERTRILDALDQCGGNQSRAARMLGMSRGKLIARLDAIGIVRPRKGDTSPEG